MIQKAVIHKTERNAFFHMSRLQIEYFIVFFSVFVCCTEGCIQALGQLKPVSGTHIRNVEDERK